MPSVFSVGLFCGEALRRGIAADREKYIVFLYKTKYFDKILSALINYVIKITGFVF